MRAVLGSALSKAVSDRLIGRNMGLLMQTECGGQVAGRGRMDVRSLGPRLAEDQPATDFAGGCCRSVPTTLDVHAHVGMQIIRPGKSL